MFPHRMFCTRMWPARLFPPANQLPIVDQGLKTATAAFALTISEQVATLLVGLAPSAAHLAFDGTSTSANLPVLVPTSVLIITEQGLNPMAFILKQSDTMVPLQAQLKDAAGAIVDLTGAGVKFHMRVAGSATSVIVNAVAQIVGNPINGTVQYNWLAADTAQSGNYEAEFEVTFSTGQILSFPNVGFIGVSINPQIA